MKVLAVAVAGLLLAGAVQAGEKAEKEGMVCHAMGGTTMVRLANHSEPSDQGDMSPNLTINVAPTFYVTSARDYKACRKIARDKGAHVIIDPNA
ncbi:hypothetical protein [Endozoicomonas ascidiicola]|uniref:hypothetical protein n=1 Tax=Endozoicomonas ascidiicola TaxID=1698521 RepID=UPI000836119C|nr:hypothetical protein [Endozoicomonas ascidiicola]